MAKMKIFSVSEKNTFESPPVFNSIERKQVFDLPLTLTQAINNLKTPTNKVCFLATFGYFKTRHRFFARQFHKKDLKFIAKKIGVNLDEVQLEIYSKATYRRHQSIILNYFGCSPFNEQAMTFTQTEISSMVQVQARPKLILLKIIQELMRKKIAIPSYHKLSTLIINAFNQHKQMLNQTIKSHLNKEQKNQLDSLLEKVTGSGLKSKWRYQITLIKKISHSTRPAKIKENIGDFKHLLGLHLEFNPVIKQLGLNYECLHYYAHSVIKSRVHQLSRRAEDGRYLHLLSFIIYQTLKLQDLLIDTMLLAVKATINVTRKAHQECYYEERENKKKSINLLVDDFKKGVLGTIETIKIIIAKPELTAEEKIKAITTTVNKPQAKKKLLINSSTVLNVRLIQFSKVLIIMTF